MKAGICGLLLILLSGTGHCQTEGECSLESTEEDRYFPDISTHAVSGGYQMAVDFTLTNKKMTDYFVEYYDLTEYKGRIDRMHDDDLKRYYYYTAGFEAFEISVLKWKCEERNESIVPDFMEQLGMYDWLYRDEKQIIHGPSAMFKFAYELDKKDHSKVSYMGKSEIDVRGIPAVYWRRCLRTNLTADYYFSAENREGVYGDKRLSLIPLRIQIYGVDDQKPEAPKELFPQNYEIMTYTPFLDDPYYTFELPVGMGCGRKPREDDNPIPEFGKQSLYIQAEVIYTDYSGGSPASYSSEFTFAYDIESEYLSYFYTTWETVDGKLQASLPIYVVYDTRNKYVFNLTYSEYRCDVGGLNRFFPSYILPGGNKGYISLTDPSIFYPDNEFYYLGEGMDRGYKVDIFEAPYLDGYLLGDRVVKNTVVTHYYLKADEFKDGKRSVEQALTRIRISLNGTEDKEGKKMNAVLNFNLFGFTTAVDDKDKNFYIAGCLRDDDDVAFNTIGFTAEQSELDLIKDDIPSAVQNARTFLTVVADIPPARLPQVMIDLQEALYVTFIILERPPFQLDFDEPKGDTYISGAAETQGITILKECGYKCLEGTNDCWGFAHCGATCYIGTGDKKAAPLTTKPGCVYFNRTNFGIVPSLRTVRRNLERAVQKKSPSLTIAKKGGGTISFLPSYIGDAVFGKREGIFRRMGMETDSRLIVVKVGRKLTTDSGESVGRNFGSLTYGECQSLCLDYKACETVSYCLSSGECILSLTHAEDIPDSKFVEDGFCNVVTRKYSDAFTRSPGEALSRSAKKLLDAANEEDCAKACMKETSFNCLSFDNCRTKDSKQGCRLHDVHVLDLKNNNEQEVSNESVCGHYSKKFTYDFKRQSKKKGVGSGFLVASAVTVEQCARYCLEYNQGECNAFDSCQAADLSSSCVILTQELSEMKTANNEMCDHFERLKPVATGDTRKYTEAVAGGVGFLVFIIGCVLGGLIVYGVAYYRVNKRQ